MILDSQECEVVCGSVVLVASRIIGIYTPIVRPSLAEHRRSPRYAYAYHAALFHSATARRHDSMPFGLQGPWRMHRGGGAVKHQVEVVEADKLIVRVPPRQSPPPPPRPRGGDRRQQWAAMIQACTRAMHSPYARSLQLSNSTASVKSPSGVPARRG